MPIQANSLKIYVHSDDGDHGIVLALCERLVRDGVTVLLPDKTSVDTQAEARRLVQESHTVLICISRQFNKAGLRRKETQIVLETILKKPGGATLVLPVRLENCNMPADLRRWQALDLFEENGYERLMLALKLRADRVGTPLPVRNDWKTRFEVKQESVQQPPKKRSGTSVRMLFGIFVLAALSTFFFWNRMFAPPTATLEPADVLAQRATQNALAYSQSRASTMTAIAFSMSDPLTQTAAFRTGVPLTKTRVREISLYTPTPTITPSLTFTPRTIVVLPTQIMDVNNIPMVLVPEGGFRMGNDKAEENVKPEYVIYLLAYYIDQYEVTNAMYQPCVQAGACSLPKAVGSATRSNYYGSPDYKDYPVINVDWQMAKQYCEWRGARLPTEAEWEKAARGTDGRTYPWGEEIGCSYANYREAANVCVGDTTQVGRYKNGQSLYGTFDMAGNVFEWVSSLYVSYPYNSLDGREVLSASGSRILRGGSWANSADGIASFYRLSVDPRQYAVAGNDVGFRCARDANP